jgi:hypothetical protein
VQSMDGDGVDDGDDGDVDEWTTTSGWLTTGD